MIASEKIKRRLKFHRPSLRARARAPKQRTSLGAQFSAANLSSSLAMQHCTHCGYVQYPPTELCGRCLEDALVYRDTIGTGVLLARTELHHSLWEFFKRRLQQGTWVMGSVKLDAGPVVLLHIGDIRLKPRDRVIVFSHSDNSQSVVLIAVPEDCDITESSTRHEIVGSLGLDQPALKEGGI